MFILLWLLVALFWVLFNLIEFCVAPLVLLVWVLRFAFCFWWFICLLYFRCLEDVAYFKFDFRLLVLIVVFVYAVTLLGWCYFRCLLHFIGCLFVVWCCWGCFFCGF